jgi:hypothetical protein
MPVTASQAQAAVESAKKHKKEKKAKKAGKISSMDLEKVKKKRDKYKAKYKACAKTLSDQGLRVWPDKPSKGTRQSSDCSNDYKNWKKYEREAARRAVKGVFKSAAEQKAALNAANATAVQASSEGAAVQSFVAQGVPQEMAAAMLQPGLSARKEHAEGVGRAHRRAKKKGTSLNAELAAVPSEGEFLAEAEVDPDVSEGDEDEGWGWKPWIAGAVLIFGAGGAYYVYTRKKPVPVGAQP